MAKGQSKPEIWAWEDDPGAPDSGAKPTQRPAPVQPGTALPIAIEGRRPPPDLYETGTKEFRYWVAAEALRRGADLWSGSAPGLQWVGAVGAELTIRLDQGEDLNAYYDRSGLSFFHDEADGVPVYSGESPDVLCHELGHAVLDALRPQTWDAPYLEVAALHESFGDMSSVLSALQLDSVRAAVLVATKNRIYRSSRLSRLAEQLGWAIRQEDPDATDRDCLREAVNSFFYVPPETLPDDGPASTLTSESHSFSRVFTAAFLESLAGMFGLDEAADEATLLRVSEDLALLLVDAVVAAPVVSSYYSQMAAHLIEADATRFAGKYTDVLKAAFVKRGILSLASANAISTLRRAAPAPRTLAAAIGEGEPRLHLLALPGQPYGLDEDLLVPAIAETKRFAVAGAALDVGAVEPLAHDRAAAAFVEALFRGGRVLVTAGGGGTGAGRARPSSITHEVRRTDEGLVLRRRLFAGGDKPEEAEERFVAGLVKRGEAVVPDNEGGEGPDLPPGATHEIVEEGDAGAGGQPKVRRRRFSISGRRKP
ncbi:MAG: hypothetical protein ACRDZ7_09535 [Acidimicrobiia bacterium]